MKRNTLALLLAVETGACIAFAFARLSFSGVFSTALAFPFEQIGFLLRTLSLSGAIGNVAAVLLYIIISLLPVFAMLMIRKRRMISKEDWLLPLLSLVLFSVLYIMINPGYLGALSGGMVETTEGKSVLGAMVYSVIFGYIILRVLRLFFVGGTKQLEKYMAIMLSLLNVVFIYLAFGAGVHILLESIASLREGNVGNEHLLGVSYVFLVLQFIVNALPYVLNAVVVFSSLNLIDKMGNDRYSAETIDAAEGLSRWCTISLGATVLSNIGFNLLQLLFAKSLMVMNSTVQIPLFSIVFMLVVLLLTRFITESKGLKDENDMFI